MTYEHPVWTGPHTPEITTHDLGVKVACSCGWWTTTETQPTAARAFMAHARDEKANERGGR